MSQPDSLIGKHLGDYEIVNILGSGGMARVYRGYDRKLDRYAAVKVIKISPVDLDLDDSYRERFQREARAIARLNHPSIVSIYQFGEYEELYYMAMEFVEGHDLSQVIRKSRSEGTLLSYQQIAGIIRDIAGALDYAHAQGVIHRDIKPSNIMVTAGGRAVLTDFGLALDSHEGTLGNAFGSVHYISPEQAVSSAQVTPQSDIYSLGVVLYEMLTGRVPFEDSSAMRTALMHITETPPALHSLNPDIAPEIEAVVMKVLSKEPEERYLTGAAFMQALEAALIQTGDMQNRLLPSGHSAQSDTVILESAGWDTLPLSETESSVKVNRSRIDRSRWAIGMIIVLALIGLALASSNVFNSSNSTTTTDPDEESNTQPPTQIVAVADATETASVTPPTPTRTNSPVVSPVRTLTEPTATITIEPRLDNITIVAGSQFTPSPTPRLRADELDDAEILLRYDGRTLLLYNRTRSRILDIHDLSFVRVTTEGINVTFRATEWQGDAIYVMRPAECMQVWTIRYRMLPPDEFPAEICLNRQAFRQTSRPFWVSNQTNATFTVQRDGEILAECLTVPSESEIEMRCVVKLPE